MATIPKFYMHNVEVNATTGAETVFPAKDLEASFVGLRYKQITGLNYFGEPKGHYTESFVEENGVRHFSPMLGNTVKETDVTLTLYFFGHTLGASDEELYKEARETYYQFCGFILTTSLLVYYDNVRRRKVKLYYSSATSPKTDRLYGEPYLEVSFKFKNMFGQSSELDDDFEPYITSL